MNRQHSTTRDAFQTGGQIAGHMVAMILGFMMMLVGMGMGVTMVLLPLGLPIGLIGFIMFIWGMTAQVRRQNQDDQRHLPTSQA